MSNEKYDDDPCLFTRSEALWANRITAESLIFGEGWEQVDKRTAAGKILFEVSSIIEQTEINHDLVSLTNIVGLKS